MPGSFYLTNEPLAVYPMTTLLNVFRVLQEKAVYQEESSCASILSVPILGTQHRCRQYLETQKTAEAPSKKDRQGYSVPDGSNQVYLYDDTLRMWYLRR
ncbi:hypothetical protein CVT25_007161 [Psilocybe cyanescens]|uniref:Uncharacterized protein n=1 Tax=Psilocybe cyanescens TaxID=93625 RepID=A0A409WVM2_PSICY|nr:hypothetical protein CVT25_007161 [Psilocybe cyanescens]